MSKQQENTVNIRIFERTWKRLKKRAVDERKTLMQLLEELSQIKI